MASNNKSLHNAGKAKDDEFYTQLPYIERELKHYKHHFKNKVVFCNCDDPKISKFFHYFSYNFNSLKLKKLITTGYKNRQLNLFSKNNSKRALYMEINRVKGNEPNSKEIKKYLLKEDGDFRSKECINILKKVDVVVTNPPFSLFREYVAQLVEYKKKFLILSDQNAMAHKDIFPLVKDNKIWNGYHVGDMEFRVPDYYKKRATRYWVDDNGNKWRSLGTICWLTNLDIDKRHEKPTLYETYSPKKYPKYDNYPAIEVREVKKIPMDYKGEMGVPLTFLSQYNPFYFKIIGMDMDLVRKRHGAKDRFYINGNKKYARIVIKNRRPVNTK